MSSKHFSFLDNCEQYVFVKLLQKDHASYVDPATLTGYCSYKKHKGYVTEPTMFRHNCIGKKCSYFEPFRDFPYWKKIEQSICDFRHSVTKKMLQKTVLDDDSKRRIRRVQDAANQLGFEITVIDVTPDEKRKDVVRVDYVSPKAYNDWEEYRGLINYLYEQYGKYYVLRHMQNKEGKYIASYIWNSQDTKEVKKHENQSYR